MKKNILFLLIDCLRADVAYGEKGQAQTPTLSSLRKRGTTFSNAISVASNPSPSVASMLTGLYPYAHGIRSLLGYKLHPDCVTLAELLKRQGYKTCAMVSGPLTEEMGLNRGFDRYQWRSGNSHFYNGFGDELVTFIRERFPDGPWFLFVHFFELHVPRRVTERFRSSHYGKAPYEQSLSCLDWHLGEVLKEVDMENTMVILHADHGEKYLSRFWENIIPRYKKQFMRIGWRLGPESRLGRSLWLGHSYHCYDFLMRVPLIIAGKGIFPEDRTITSMVSQIYILATILDGVGQRADMPGKIEGKSLIPLLSGEDYTDRHCYVQACDPEIPETEWLAGLRTTRWKYLIPLNGGKRNPMLYDLQNDPYETRNVIDNNPRVVEELQKEFAEMITRGAQLYSPDRIRMSDDEKEKVGSLLKELGYL